MDSSLLLHGNYKLVGFAGAAGSGKDTAATFVDQAIRKANPLTAPLRVAFAGPVKAAAAAKFCFDVKDFDDRELKEAPLDGFPGLTRRRCAQLEGTEYGRDAYGEDIWVRAAWRTIKKEGTRLGPGYDCWVLISDVRFENEAKWILTNGGIVIRIERPNNNVGTTHSDHPSEAGFPDHLVTETVKNVGTLETLQDEVVGVVRENFII